MIMQRHRLILFSAAFYLLLIACLGVKVLRATNGHMLYALDDPYIHLALAENLAHGHYGINPSEFSSPASSILWPFLLVPLAGTALHAYVPFAWNLIFGVASACLIGLFISRWPPRTDSSGRMPWWQQAATAALLIFTANLASLTFVGMEHGLQIFLSICCAFGIAEVLSGRTVPAWCLAAAVLAPAVRYEDLSLTLALCIALAGLRRWKTACAIFAVSLLPLLAFSAFLKSKALPALPMSVLVKGSVFKNTGLLDKAISLLKNSAHQDLTSPERYPILLLFLIFASLSWTAAGRQRRFAFAGAAALGALQLTLGRFGWFHRYEIYALIFLVLLLLRVLAERPRFMFGYYVVGLMFFAAPYIGATAQTPTAVRSLYEQQFQMHRFVTQFYHGDYAVNDLGLVSFQRTPGVYVLDVYGLASVEASRQSNKSAAWLDGIVKRHNIALAILYPGWFHIPAEWVPLGAICVEDVPALILGQPCTVFYSTSQQQQSTTRTAFKQFLATLPGGVKSYLPPPDSTDALWQPPTSTIQP